MDLSFARLHAGQVTALPVELAVLMVGVASRQAASPTAQVQSGIGGSALRETLLAPASGCFCPATATKLSRWKEE